MITAHGTVYLGKTAPLATTAQDGTFALTLLAFDRLGVHQVEPWRITYAGLGAQTFWSAHRAELQPGQPIEISVERLRTFTNGRNGAPELHAQVTRIALAPKAAHVTHHHHQEQAAPCQQSH